MNCPNLYPTTRVILSEVTGGIGAAGMVMAVDSAANTLGHTLAGIVPIPGVAPVVTATVKVVAGILGYTTGKQAGEVAVDLGKVGYDNAISWMARGLQAAANAANAAVQPAVQPAP